MDDPLDYIERMMEDNRKARERATARFRRLAESLTTEEPNNAISEVLDEYQHDLESTGQEGEHPREDG
ncbi:MAG: hypothetical protein HKN35_15930 [Woeseia sp.]|nr:hypothetical protein [Woeseia sp.]